MKKDAKIYIAGHRGLVGSAILRRLEVEGYSNLLLRSHGELDLEKQNEVEEFFHKEKPEYVFLVAAKVGGIHANSSFPAEFIYTNLAIQTNVIHAAWKTGISRLIYLGSSCIYPRDCPQPMKEEFLLTGPLEITNRPYAIAKIAGVIQCESYNRQYGTRFLAVMPTNLYGPNDNYDLENSHMLPAMIRKFHLAKLAVEGRRDDIEKDEAVYGPIPENIKLSLCISPSQKPINQLTNKVIVQLWGTGSVYREFLHSDDLADASLFLMNLADSSFDDLLFSESASIPSAPDALKNTKIPLINIGCGEDYTIREYADQVSQVVEYKGGVDWDYTKPDGTPRKLLDISKMTSLEWKPKISLANGLRCTYKSYVERLRL